MFHAYRPADAGEQLTVCGIPFYVSRNENGAVQSLPLNPRGTISVPFQASCEAIFFLGMATDAVECSEWWGMHESDYDHSLRLFFGDRLMRIQIVYDDDTEELISLIFGVNCWNYHLYYKPHAHENLNDFGAPYQEPFASDPAAAALKEAALQLMENTDPCAERGTKWVFGYRVRPDKRVRELRFVTERDSKRSNVVISAFTGLNAGSPIDPAWKLVDQDFFLGRKYYAALDKMARRLYQYRDELPAQVDKLPVKGYDAPDVTFSGNGLADIFTNVYRVNVMDMAYNKVDDEGGTHTSSPDTANFGSYLGFGTFQDHCTSYASHVWTRDIGRTLMEIINAGYMDRVLPAIDYLHTLLYYPSLRFHIPHWKRVANLVAQDENDLFNEGKENDGHASIMLAVYSLYRKGGVDKAWLLKNEQHLRAAADYYLWQRNNPDLSNYREGMLFSESEASTQTFGGYDVFSNLISAYALTGYARLFRVIGNEAYADTLDALSAEIREGVRTHFTMEHPRYGQVLTDTIDDGWTYEYKRMVDLLIQSDLYGYDLADNDPALFDLMNRTFSAQKESFYAPESGRQMGYGQGYLTQSVIMLDRYEEFSDCVEAAAMMCYHHTDHSYIVPEGVIMHGSKNFWFRNSDLGNAVQQAETLKCARLLLGIDDISPESGIRLVPRLPLTWNSLSVNDYPVTKKDRSITHMNLRYTRTADASVSGRIEATDGCTRYVLDWETDADVSSVRVGPFERDTITVSGADNVRIVKINNRYFARITL